MELLERYKRKTKQNVTPTPLEANIYYMVVKTISLELLYSACGQDICHNIFPTSFILDLDVVVLKDEQPPLLKK